MEVIGVSNRKGGVGKTTVATHLASGLALAGYRVGMVDTDPQGHAALALGMPKENGLYYLFSEERVLEEVVKAVPRYSYVPEGYEGNPFLCIIPGDKATVAIPALDGFDVFQLRGECEYMAEALNLDYVVIDTGPTASLLDSSVNFAANYYLYVTEAARLSFDGLKESINELEMINKRNNKYRPWEAQIMGILPNKARFSTVAQREQIADLMQHYADYVWHPLMLGTTWQECSDYAQTVYKFAPGSREDGHARRLVNQALAKMGVPHASW